MHTCIIAGTPCANYWYAELHVVKFHVGFSENLLFLGLCFESFC